MSIPKCWLECSPAMRQSHTKNRNNTVCSCRLIWYFLLHAGWKEFVITGILVGSFISKLLKIMWPLKIILLLKEGKTIFESHANAMDDILWLSHGILVFHYFLFCIFLPAFAHEIIIIITISVVCNEKNMWYYDIASSWQLCCARIRFFWS